MKINKLIALVFLICFTTPVFSVVSYTLRVLNQSYSGTDFFFEVYLQSTGEDLLYLASSDIYLDFNEGNFSSATATKVATGSSLSYYSVGVTIDGSNRIVVSILQPGFSDQPEFDARVALISTSGNGTYIGKYKISSISNPNGTAGLAWYYSGTSGTDIYYFNNSTWVTYQITSYSNVDPSDASLPVQMNKMEATAAPGVGITLTWHTQSETNSTGFHIWRSSSETGSYQRVSNSFIQSHGNSSSENIYKFTDMNAQDANEYWYKIEEISMDGMKEFFGPISVQGIPLPTEYIMAQNYPNPFNPETTIKYELPEVSEVSVKVFTLLGKEVKTLVNKTQNIGRYEVKWNGLDNGGKRVPSGIYFVRIQAGSFSQIRKMTFIQ